MDFTIATKNSGGTIRRCIESIIQNIPPANLDSVIVVDNGSSDNTLSIVDSLKKKYPGLIRIVPEPGLFGLVRYAQAANAKGEWVAIIDSDIYIYKNWWESVEPYIRRSDVGWILGSPDSFHTEPYLSYYNWQLKRLNPIAMSNAVVRRRFILDSIDSIRSTHHESEPTIYKRMRSQGYKMEFIRKSVALHEGDKDEFLYPKNMRAGQSYRMYNGLLKSLLFKLPQFVLFNLLIKPSIYFIESRPGVLSFISLLFIQFNICRAFLKGLFMKAVVIDITKSTYK